MCVIDPKIDYIKQCISYTFLKVFFEIVVFRLCEGRLLFENDGDKNWGYKNIFSIDV